MSGESSRDESRSKLWLIHWSLVYGGTGGSGGQGGEQGGSGEPGEEILLLPVGPSAPSLNLVMLGPPSKLESAQENHAMSSFSETAVNELIIVITFAGKPSNHLSLGRKVRKGRHILRPIKSAL
jgi:hypothetical protein